MAKRMSPASQGEKRSTLARESEPAPPATGGAGEASGALDVLKQKLSNHFRAVAGLHGKKSAQHTVNAVLHDKFQTQHNKIADALGPEK